MADVLEIFTYLRPKKLSRGRPIAAYDQAVGAFDNDHGLNTLLNSCYGHVDHGPHRTPPECSKVREHHDEASPTILRLS